MIGIGIVPADQKMRGIPGMYHGSYGYHSDGTKHSWRTEGQGESYGLPFTRGDVIGCGWNMQDGTIFFTKNGKHQGIAFKNVYGTFFAAVGVDSMDVTMLANFGQMPILYDLAAELTAAQGTHIERNGQVGHSALSICSEIVMLLRLLLQSSLWQPHIMKAIVTVWNRIPLLSKNIADPPVSSKSVSALPESIDYVNLCQLIGSIAVLGGHVDGLRIGGYVEVVVEGLSNNEKGIVLEYDRGSSTAIVSLNSNFSQLKVVNVAYLRSIPEVRI
jgi:hypothetical protein